MNGFGSQLVLAALVLATSFAGPVLALWLLLARKRRARAARRSPLGADLLRGPGHALLLEAEDLRFDVMGYLMALAFLPSVLLATHLAQSYLLGVPESLIRTGFVSVFIVGGMLLLLRKLLTTAGRLDTLRLGIDAEVAAGQELDQLMRQGAVVFHDFPAEKFNIDHVVVAPQGVFAVETKGYSKPNERQGQAGARVEYDGRMLTFPHRTTSAPIEQAERQAQWLARWLTRAIGDSVAVTPVLALPGWYVERKGRAAVRVYSGKELQTLLKARGIQSLTAQEVQRVAHQIDQRCRNVKPLYGMDGD
ncbi:nuclease-related domain-containing protein [Methylibium petroleiphilum]